MRKLVALSLLLAFTGGVEGQGDKDKDKGKKELVRYGLEQDLKRYPQSAAKEALASVLRAIGDKRFDYLLAHLADPGFVDKRVELYAANLSAKLPDSERRALAFNKFAEEVGDNFTKDPTKFKELQRFLKEAEWDEGEGEVVARLKGVTARKVFMKKVPPDRWVLLDREK
jgi:hypothetical protein